MANAQSPPIKAAQQRGLSIVELLISLVIGMAVIAGAIQVMVSSKRSFMDQDEVSFIQTNARYALDLMGKDIRMAGYLGCAAPGSVEKADAIDKTKLDEKLRVYVSLEGLRGFEWGSTSAEFPDDFKDQATADTDALIIRRAGDRELNIQEHKSTTQTITLWENHNYAVGSTLMVSDANCRNVGLFQLSGPSAVPSPVIQHKQAGTSNCTSIIKGEFSCSGSPGPPAPPASSFYSPGSKLMEFVAHAYYIGESTVIPGMPALRRQVFNANGSPSTSSEEIALGVEDMKILYGIDSNGNGNVDEMRKASEITDWARVISVQVSLVFRSQMPVLSIEEKKTLAGTEYNDRYMRQVVNSTIRIRNRG
jgi:type IV pilus assembly protein PilW